MIFGKNIKILLSLFFKLFYHNYLKYNQQKDGLKSYSQIMGLIISFESSYSLHCQS